MKWTGPFRRLREDVLALGFAAEFFSDALLAGVLLCFTF